MAAVAVPFNTLVPEDIFNALLSNHRTDATKAGYALLDTLHDIHNEGGPELQIGTAESLTGGLIMSTLVDIPWLGNHKYGGFVVYDTDAKRTMIGVTTDNVYTHKCAAEMAIGILKNSNATIGLAVTGNAMPSNPNVNRLGEVFMGVAGYVTIGDTVEIICKTHAINACHRDSDFRSVCKEWYDLIKKTKDFNPRTRTATINQLIRYYTTEQALDFCNKFVLDNTLIVPPFVTAQKQSNKETIINPKNKKHKELIHNSIPINKYDNDTIFITYLNPEANNSSRSSVQEYPETPAAAPNGSPVALSRSPAATLAGVPSRSPVAKNEGGRRRLKRTRKQKR